MRVNTGNVHMRRIQYNCDLNCKLSLDASSYIQQVRSALACSERNDMSLQSFDICTLIVMLSHIAQILVIEYIVRGHICPEEERVDCA